MAAVSRPTSLSEVAAGIGTESALLDAARTARKRPDNVLGLLVRDLTHQEIAIMEGRGSRADDWSLIQVAQDFDPFRVRRSHLIGRCILGRFGGEVAVRPGISLPTGIYGCTLIDCQVGNDCLLENVRFAASTVVEHGGVLFDVGSITASESVRFGCGASIPIGPETGGREVPLWAEMDVVSAERLAKDRGDEDGHAAVATALADYLSELDGNLCWIRRGAVVRHTDRLHDVYLGPGAVVDQATDLDDVAVCSTAEEPTSISGAATVQQAILQRGVSVGGGAIVRSSVLIQHSAVDAQAVVENAIIGANCHIAKGEVTASLVGPFTGLHHQSLLIGALWPEGKGNVAYGAMVGSNHTGRAPDQEIWPGEGTFFGLGVNIKLPTDLSASPYTIIGSGVATLAQRIAFPFSLVSTPIEAITDEDAIPRAYNELLPGWGLYANAYAVVRAEMKFAKRDRTKDQATPYQVFRPSIMALVRDALERLEAVEEPREIYTEDHIVGLGKNFLRESIRIRAIEAYRTALKRYALRVLLADAEGHQQLPGSVEVSADLADWLMPDSSRDERLRALVDIERANVDIVARAKRNDDARGQRIIPGYADTHPTLEEDDVYQAAVARVASTEQRIARLLGD